MNANKEWLNMAELTTTWDCASAEAFATACNLSLAKNSNNPILMTYIMRNHSPLTVSRKDNLRVRTTSDR